MVPSHNSFDTFMCNVTGGDARAALSAQHHGGPSRRRRDADDGLCVRAQHRRNARRWACQRQRCRTLRANTDEVQSPPYQSCIALLPVTLHSIPVDCWSYGLCASCTRTRAIGRLLLCAGAPMRRAQVNLRLPQSQMTQLPRQRRQAAKQRWTWRSTSTLRPRRRPRMPTRRPPLQAHCSRRKHLCSQALPGG